MKKIEIFCTVGPRSLNKNFLKFSDKNVDLLRINMSHVNLKSIESIVKKIRKFTKTPICLDTEGAQIRTKIKKIKKFNVGNRLHINFNEKKYNFYPENIIKKFEKNDSRIKIVNVKNNEAFWGNRKYALTLGIKSAKYEQLLFTDANCMPSSREWIKEMSLLFSESKSIILGFVTYPSKKYSFLNTLIRFEKLLSTIHYFSYAKLKSPYMADGKNLAYKKSDFFRVNGFINHIKINSGHDNLFIRDASTSSNTTIALSPNSHIISETPNTLREWFYQKKNHIKTTSHYKLKHKLLIGLYNSSKLLFLFLIPFILIFKTNSYSLIIILSYISFNYLIIGYCAKKLHETSLIYLLPFLELFLVLFQFAIFITNSISKPTHWK